MAINIAVVGALMFAFSIILIAGSAFYLVKSLSRIAKVVGISAFVIGIVILAIATSVPDFLAVLISSFQGIADLGVGDIIGGSLIDLCLNIGLVSMITKNKIGKVENRIFAITLTAVLLFLFLGMDGNFSRFDGIILFGLFVATQIYLFKIGFKRSHKHAPIKKLAMAYIIAPIAFFTLVVSAFLLVNSSSYLAKSAGIPLGIVGMLLVPIGTTAPDLSASLISALKKGEGLALGNAIGSVMTNFLFAGGLVALIHPFSFNFELFRIPLYVLVAALIFFITYVNIRKSTDRFMSFIMLGFFSFYLYMVLSALL